MIYFALREILKERGISEYSFMRKLNVRPDTFYKACNNQLKRIPVDFLEAVCEELDIQPGEIIKRVSDK